MGTGAGSFRVTRKWGGPDPVPASRFLLDAGVPIGHFTEVSGLSVAYDPYEYKEGGVNDFTHVLRGRAKFTNLVLKRGFTNETALFDWFHECRERTARRDVTLTLLGPDSKTIRTWAIEGAFPIKWTGPDFKTNAGDAAVESLEIAHRGFTVK
jgi:phage tail-like protein